MSRSPVRLLIVILALVVAGTCRFRESGRVDSTALHDTPNGPVLRVTILGDATDARVTPAREALTHWNGEFRRLGRHVQFAQASVSRNTLRDEAVRAAGSEAVLGGGPATWRLLASLSSDSSDVVIILTHADLISFSVRWRSGDKGIVGIRRSDILPLSLPNTVRNVVAHELGHVLGLGHNRDPSTLMCGRPASCRPAAFASDSTRFFPLTAGDEAWIVQRWP